jgi:hypothetical protein
MGSSTSATKRTRPDSREREEEWFSAIEVSNDAPRNVDEDSDDEEEESDHDRLAFPYPALEARRDQLDFTGTEGESDDGSAPFAAGIFPATAMNSLLADELLNTSLPPNSHPDIAGLVGDGGYLLFRNILSQTESLSVQDARKKLDSSLLRKLAAPKVPAQLRKNIEEAARLISGGDTPSLRSKLDAIWKDDAADERFTNATWGIYASWSNNFQI